jgi:hypothetical protein
MIDGLLNYLGLTGGSVIFLKLVYDWWKRSAPANAQAGANRDLYEMLVEQNKRLDEENRRLHQANVLLEKQLLVLETIAKHHQIDVVALYKEHGVNDDK